MRNPITKLSFIALFAGLAIFSFNCTPVKQNEPTKPNPNAKYILEELRKKGYTLNKDYELDEKGFPFWKGRYTVVLNEKNRTPEGMKRVQEELKSTLMKEFKTIRTVTFEDCMCGWLINVKIDSGVETEPSSEKIKPKLTSIGGVSEANSDYIVYDNEDPSKQVANPYDADYAKKMMAQKPTPNRSVVGLLDTGMDLQALAPVVMRTPENGSDTSPRNCLSDDMLGYNFIDKNNNVWDNFGHGTHIASNIAKYNNNSVKILAVKTHDKDGLGSLFSVTCGTIYASDMGAKIINASWVIIHDNASDVAILKTAIDYAKRKNVLFVSTAGNNGLEISDKFKVFPAYFYPNVSNKKDEDNVIVVGAVDLTRTPFSLNSFSNRGAKYVDILADGTTPNYTLTGTPNANGTSLSTGVVTALAAQIHQSTPGITYLNLKNSILGNPLTIVQGSLAPQVANGRVLKINLN
jgi:hypothetical protein